MAMGRRYEWDFEQVDEFGDIQDHDFWDQLPPKGHDIEGREMVLVLNHIDRDDFDDVKDREWAYVKDGRLPERFDGGTKVPQRFHRDLARWLEA